MNISGMSKFASKSIAGLDVRRRLFKLIPNMTINGEAFVNKIGTALSRPDVNRAVMGATAILTQPLIDYYNPKVDRDTAIVSTCRTVGKIIAGTLVGCGVRSLCYYGVHALTSLSKTAPAWRKTLLPPKAIIRYLSNKNNDWLKNYRSTLATIVGLGAMLFTNVLLDVPFTHMISKKLISKFKGNDENNINIPNNTTNSVQPYEHYEAADKFRKIFIDNFNIKDRRTS